MLELDNIYCMDCLDGMAQLEDGNINFVISDPPYNVGKEFEKGINFDYLINEYTKCVYDKLNENGWFVFTCPCNKIDYFIEVTKKHGFKFERILFYYKRNKFTDVWIGWLLTSEAILLFSKGKPNKSNSNKESYNHDVYTIKSINKNHPDFVNHQSVKSLDVWKHIISVLSDKNGIVLDPFMGSGTTGVACKELDRHFIGFEINPEYCKLADERIANVQRQSVIV